MNPWELKGILDQLVEFYVSTLRQHVKIGIYS